MSPNKCNNILSSMLYLFIHEILYIFWPKLNHIIQISNHILIRALLVIIYLLRQSYVHGPRIQVVALVSARSTVGISCSLGDTCVVFTVLPGITPFFKKYHIPIIDLANKKC